MSSLESKIVSMFMSLVRSKNIKRIAYVEKHKTYTITITESWGTDWLRWTTLDMAFIDENLDKEAIEKIKSRIIINHK